VSAAIFSIVSVQIRRQREFGRASDRSPPELGPVGGDVRSGSGTTQMFGHDRRYSAPPRISDIQCLAIPSCRTVEHCGWAFATQQQLYCWQRTVQRPDNTRLSGLRIRLSPGRVAQLAEVLSPESPWPGQSSMAVLLSRAALSCQCSLLMRLAKSVRSTSQPSGKRPFKAVTGVRGRQQGSCT
jgi:hypothetical protein